MSNHETVKISLDHLLRTGEFSKLRPGMSKDDVQRLLGSPDAVGNTSRKYREPSIFLYGSVEFWFRQQNPKELTGIYWEAGDKGAFRLTDRCEITEWAFMPDWLYPQVVEYLDERELQFDVEQESSHIRIVLPNGVRITFDEEQRIWSLLASGPT